MTCKEVALWILAEDEGPGLPTLEEHLRGCESCRALWPEVEALHRMRALGAAEPTPRLALRRRRAARSKGLVAAAVALVLLSLVCWEGSSPAPQAPPKRVPSSEMDLEPGFEARISHSSTLIAGEKPIQSEVTWTRTRAALPQWIREQNP